MPQSSVSPRRRRVALIILLLLLTALGLLLSNRNRVYDWWRLYGYTPPAAVAQFAQDDTMTPAAKHLFYVNRPSLQDKSTFSTHCPSGTEQSVVLGCYKSVQRGIYVLTVDTPDLAGIEQVTAAHEMLHAAYDRLSNHERVTIDSQLQAYYDSGLVDADIKATIDSYRQTEPDDVVNEMHSIFGTEIVHLPAGLQSYYGRYFTDRSKVTNYYVTYNQAFTSRQKHIKADDAQLNSNKTTIDTLTATVKQQQASLTSQRQALTTTPDNPGNDYDSKVDAYNKSVLAYNADVRQLQSLIAAYNQLVADRNAIAIEERQLVQAISATPISQ